MATITVPGRFPGKDNFVVVIDIESGPANPVYGYSYAGPNGYLLVIESRRGERERLNRYADLQSALRAASKIPGFEMSR